MATVAFPPLRLEAPFQTMLASLLQAGAKVWIVGGWVRDCLRGVAAHDADFCTDAAPETIAKAAAQAGVVVLLDKVAAQHGTYRLGANGQTLDLARLRRDVARVGARHAQVAFATTLEQDLCRRDLTINALALPYPPPKKALAALIDQHGGRQDLKAHRLRLIGNAQERLREDPLRLLRIARFACMGEPWHIESTTARAMAASAALVASVSVERRLAEWMRALALPCPHRFWQTVEACDAYAALLPGQTTAAQRAEGTRWLALVAPSLAAPMLRQTLFLMGALSTQPAPPSADAVGPRSPPSAPAPAPATLGIRSAARQAALHWMAPLRFPKAWQDTVSHLVAARALPEAPRPDEAIVRWTLALGPQHFDALLTLCVAAAPLLPHELQPTLQILQRAQSLAGKRVLWRGEDLPLNAAQLFEELDVPPGSQRRWLLHELLVHAWLHPEQANEAALIAAAKSFNPVDESTTRRPKTPQP